MGYTPRMKRCFLILIICLCPGSLFAHPGKTDLYGGHKCLKSCEVWGLFYEEYHLHDKDWKPIRISKKKAAGKGPGVSPIVQENEPTSELKSEVVTTTRYITVIHEENIFSTNPLLFVLLLLLLLLLILRVNRKNTS